MDKFRIEKYDKENLSFISIKNEVNFEVVFCSLGASIYTIRYEDKLMTLSPSKLSEFAKIDFYQGKTIGRTAGRIRGNQITINSQTYTLQNNQGPDTLHGGKQGISAAFFTANEISTSEEGAAILIYSYNSPDLESGYPGNMTIKITYEIPKDKPTIKITIEADTDKDTLCSMTNHTFFTVGEPNLNTVSLKINAGNFLAPNPVDLIPIEKRPVTQSLNFKELKPIMKEINDPYLMNSKTKGYDHFFYLDKIDSTIPQSELVGKTYKMSVFTDYSGIVIYTDNYEGGDFLEVTGEIRRGIAVEPQETQLIQHVLKKDEHYKHFIRLEFGKI